LCLEDKEIRKSHIIPEFMYQNVYDSNPRRFHSLNVDKVEPELSTSRIEQKGIREYLLCDECEGKLSKNERYASETIYGTGRGNSTYFIDSQVSENHDEWLDILGGFSYYHFKLFQMSLLWRLIISETFKTPEVGADITEKLRMAIYNEDPLEFDELPCLIQSLRYSENQLVSKIILEPYVTGANSDIINILIDGFIYTFFLNSENISPDQKDFLLHSDGSMKIIGRLVQKDPIIFDKLKTAYNYYDAAIKKVE